MAKKQTTMSGDELNALLTLLKAGYKVILYKRFDMLHTIRQVYTPDDFNLLHDRDKIRGSDSEYGVGEDTGG